MDFLVSLEQSRFFIWVRESGSLFAFPTILLLHTYGMAVLVGLVAVLDLRILGFAPALPLSPLEKFLPMLWVAFWINAVTGTILLLADATTKLTNLDFLVKMLFIALGVIVQRMLEQRVFRPERALDRMVPANARMLAVASLICWLGAITAGRLLGVRRSGERSGIAWNRSWDVREFLSNTAHLHVVLNHVPTIGFCVGLVIFLIGLARRHDSLKRTGLTVFFVVANVSIATYVTGVGAEELIKDRPGRLRDRDSSTRGRGAAGIRIDGDHRLLRLAGAVAVAPDSAPDAALDPAGRARALGGDVRSDGQRRKPGRRDQPCGDSSCLCRDGGGPGRRGYRSRQVDRDVRRGRVVGVAGVRDHSLRRALHAVQRGPDRRSAHAGHDQERVLCGGVSAAAAGDVGVRPQSHHRHAVLHRQPRAGRSQRMFFWKIVLVMLGGFNVLYFTLDHEPWEVGPGDDAPLTAKIAAVSAMFLWVAVLFCGHMLPFLGDAF